MSAAVARHRHHDRRRSHNRLRLRLLIHGSVATSAIVIGGAKLNQQAVIASNDFPRIYRGKSRGHRVVGGPERAFLTSGTGTNLTFGGKVPTAVPNLQSPACGCQG